MERTGGVKMAEIVIAGAGYGGIMAGIRLERAEMPFTLVNKHTYHQFITWLHEAAGGRNSVDDYKLELRDILREPTSHLEKDEVLSIDRVGKKLIGKQAEHPYEYLIVALGSAPEYFGIAGLAEHSLLLRSLESARTIRKHIERQVADYAIDKKPERLRFIVGGAGLTGIELVGELTDWLPKLCAQYKIEASLYEIISLEAAANILPALPPNLQQKAFDSLEKKGAKLRTNTKIIKVERGAVTLESGEVLQTETLIWTGGVKAHPALAEAGFSCDARGRAKVSEYLQSVDDEEVYIIGDCASFVTGGGRPLPPTAQLATQMGQVAGANILARVQGNPQVRFVPKILGTLASLGRDRGVGSVGRVQTSGTAASLAKELTKVKYLYQLGGLRIVSRGSKALSRASE